jgi:hypothetical protein
LREDRALIYAHCLVSLNRLHSEPMMPAIIIVLQCLLGDFCWFQPRFLSQPLC